MSPFNFILCFLHAGHSCKLLTKNMGMLVINEDTLDVSIKMFSSLQVIRHYTHFWKCIDLNSWCSFTLMLLKCGKTKDLGIVTILSLLIFISFFMSMLVTLPLTCAHMLQQKKHCISQMLFIISRKNNLNNTLNWLANPCHWTYWGCLKHV